jgi:hypothetical protein
MSSVVINGMNGIENYSYLELGVLRNENYNQIRCKNKSSVDINGYATYTGTTDEYFNQLDESIRFDIIYIDANHDYDYVLRDFNNSVKRANRWILIHDMIPPSFGSTRSDRCSDSYKLLYYLLTETDFIVYSLNHNFGLTFVKMPARKINPPEHFKDTSYSVFMDFLKSKKLYDDNEIVQVLNSQ